MAFLKICSRFRTLLCLNTLMVAPDSLKDQVFSLSIKIGFNTVLFYELTQNLFELISDQMSFKKPLISGLNHVIFDSAHAWARWLLKHDWTRPRGPGSLCRLAVASSRHWLQTPSQKLWHLHSCKKEVYIFRNSLMMMTTSLNILIFKLIILPKELSHSFL